MSFDLTTAEGLKAHYKAVKDRIDFAAKRFSNEVKRDVIRVATPMFNQSDSYLTPWQQIVVEVANERGVNYRQIINGGRTKELALARQVAMWRISEELGYSYSQIGRWFKRDHTTVMHAVRKIQKLEDARLSYGDSEGDGK